jgi:2-polyprenyl-3-methyl-5-hydroxy-6-metoxy-1,4-benzoquinol methylase
MVDGVLVLLKQSFRRRLAVFTARLEQFRAAEGKRLLDHSVYEQLPDAHALRHIFEWRLRRYDLAVVSELLRNRPAQSILDVGAWNGWLSHRLAAQGHQVTAIDYFTDRYDGLGARAFYSTSWRAIQMDLTDLSPLDERFDVVVLNRCLQYFNDPAAYVMQLCEKVLPGGWLIATGLAFYQASGVQARTLAALQERYRNDYGMELFSHPCKGYLDFVDRARLAASGLALHPYRQLLAANVKSFFLPWRPRYNYLIYHKGEAAPG